MRLTKIAGMGHGTAVDPGTAADQCGTAGAYFIDTVCAAYYDVRFFGLDGGAPRPPRARRARRARRAGPRRALRRRRRARPRRPPRRASRRATTPTSSPGGPTSPADTRTPSARTRTSGSTTPSTRPRSSSPPPATGRGAEQAQLSLAGVLGQCATGVDVLGQPGQGGQGDVLAPRPVGHPGDAEALERREVERAGDGDDGDRLRPQAPRRAGSRSSRRALPGTKKVEAPASR